MKWYLLVTQPAVAFLHRMLAVLNPASPSLTYAVLIRNHTSFFVCLLVLLAGSAQAQQPAVIPEDSAYIKAVHERAGKIAATLGIKEGSKLTLVQTIVANQYRHLNQIHESCKIVIEGIKRSTTLSKEAIAEAIKKEEDKKTTQLLQQHAVYIDQLKKELSAEQVEKVKDGMTYRVLPITYAAYQDMIPRLTEEQKKQIYAWLTEAREYAMDAESSDKKHWWFGKYKGRINNYLSSAGYDLKKANEDWAKRRKATSSVSPD